jgi:hypothetical protein
VVDGGGLENHCTRKGTGGSNPSPSARISLEGVTRIYSAWLLTRGRLAEDLVIQSRLVGSR